MTLPPPQLEHICDLSVAIAAPIEIGHTPSGLRRAIPIIGGTVSGPRINGTILNCGADFQLIVAGGTQAHLDARYIIQTDDGANIYVQNTALRFATLENSQRIMRGEPVDPSAVYFRCQPRLECSESAWSWLHESQFIGTGRRNPDGVLLSFYRVV
ncbi:MAG: hypothetical protein RL295_188 [Pseudomonadota bacterium]|jgi:hypothetical protein